MYIPDVCLYNVFIPRDHRLINRKHTYVMNWKPKTELIWIHLRYFQEAHHRVDIHTSWYVLHKFIRGTDSFQCIRHSPLGNTLQHTSPLPQHPANPIAAHFATHCRRHHPPSPDAENPSTPHLATNYNTHRPLDNTLQHPLHQTVKYTATQFIYCIHHAPIHIFLKYTKCTYFTYTYICSACPPYLPSPLDLPFIVPNFFEVVVSSNSVCVRKRGNMCVGVRDRECVHVLECACVFMCACVCLCVCMRVRVCVCVCVCACIHTKYLIYIYFSTSYKTVPTQTRT